ncbi:hypothetical protein ACM66B_003102 [Microbotryomycetes sp. NB124-2]
MNARLRQIAGKAEFLLAEQFCRQFGRTVQSLKEILDTASKVKVAESALRAAYQRGYDAAVDRLRVVMLEVIQQARQRYDEQLALAAMIPRVPDSAYGTFSEETTAILLQAYSHQQTVTKAERRVLSDVTGLSDRQIRTWFGNQRQRRGMSQQQQPSQKPTTVRRATPYTKTRGETSNFSPSRPMRNFSGTSSSSLGSDESDVSEVSTAASSVQSWLDAKQHGYTHSPPQQLDTLAHHATHQARTHSTQQELLQHHQHSQYSPALQITIETDAKPRQASQASHSPDVLEYSSIYHPSQARGQVLELYHQQSVQHNEEQPQLEWQAQVDPAYVPLLPNFDFEAEARDNDFWQAFTQGDGLNELFGAIAASTNGMATTFQLPPAIGVAEQPFMQQDMSRINLMVPLDESAGIGGFWRQ